MAMNDSERLGIQLASALHAQSIKTSRQLEESKKRSGFDAGYQLGIEEGKRRARIEVQEAMGFEPNRFFVYSDEAFAMWDSENKTA